MIDGNIMAIRKQIVSINILFLLDKVLDNNSQ
jgi:hypothetical protein